MIFECKCCRIRDYCKRKFHIGDCPNFSLDETTLDLKQCVELAVEESNQFKNNNNSKYNLSPIEYNELIKAMVSRGVKYKVAKQIITDFRKRMNDLKK